MRYSIAIILLLLCTCPAMAELIDFSDVSWVKVEGDGCTIDKGATLADTVSFNDVDRNGDSYCYKDFGASYWGSSWTHRFSMKPTANGNGIVYYWMVANAVNDGAGLVGASADFCSVSLSNTSLSCGVTENGSSVGTVGTYSYTLNQTLYVTIVRSNLDYTFTVRTGGHEGTSVLSGTVSATENNSWQYLYVTNSWNSGLSARHMDGQVSAFETGSHVAATYYVATDGDDSRDMFEAQSVSTPWLTISKAVGLVYAGDTVYVRSGTYSETVTFPRSGTEGSVITLSAYTGEACTGTNGGSKTASVIIDGSGTKSFGIQTKDYSYITIAGVGVTNFAQRAFYLKDPDSTAVSHITISNCYVTDGSDGAIYGRGGTTAADDITIENCDISDDAGSGVWIGGDRTIIRRCYIHDCDKDGIDGLGADSLVEYCRIERFLSDEHPDCMDLSPNDGVIIRYCIMGDATQGVYVGDGTLASTSSNISIYGNVFYKEEYGGAMPGIIFAGDNSRIGAIDGVYIYNNTFCNLGQTAIQIYLNAGAGAGIDDVVIMNNIFVDYTWSVQTGATNVHSDYNLYYGLVVNGNDGVNSITGDPLFVDYETGVSHDVTLSAGSPAIGVGAGAVVLGGYVTLPTPFTDIEGTSRTGTTIGAYEYVADVEEFATVPSPANYASDVAITATMSWTASASAVSHDVYLGTDSATVLAATTASAEFQGNQAEITYDPTLLNDTTYYWRIDELDLFGNAMGQGTVWTFSTVEIPPATRATSPSPASPTTAQKRSGTSVVLSWTAGDSATSHDVWFGTTEAGMTRASAGQAGVTYTQSNLSPSTTYYWRVDEIAGETTTEGTVWTFTTRPARMLFGQ